MISSARSACRALLLLSISALAATAYAQVNPPTREEIERVPTAPVAPPPSRLTVEGGVERAPCPLAEPRFAIWLAVVP